MYTIIVWNGRIQECFHEKNHTIARNLINHFMAHGILVSYEYQS